MSLGRANLVVKVTASLDDMKKEMAKAEAIIATTESAMRRMSNAFDPAKTIANANAAMLRIQDLGGTTGLTEAQQRRLNQALADGITAYQALGRQAPADMIALRDATAKAVPETNALGTSAGSLTDKLKGVAGALGLAFGASAVISGVKSLVTNTLTYASTIDDTSKKLGISIEATQRYKFAAEQTGASLENVSKSVLKLSQGLSGGDKGVKEALDAAGLSFDAIRAMKPEQAFDATAAAIAKIPDPMTQARVALELFGKGGAELLPAIREGFTDIAASATVMRDTTIQRLAAAEDAWERFKNNVVIWTGELIGSAMAQSEMTDRQRQQYIALVKNGGDAAAFLAKITEENKAAAEATDRLSESFAKLQREQVLAAIAAGQSATSVAAAYGLTVAQVNAMVEASKKLTPEQEAAAKSARAAADALRRQADAYSRDGLLRDTAAHVALLKQIKQDGGFAAGELERFAKVASELRQRGAPLNAELFRMAVEFENAHMKGLPLVGTLQSINTALKAVYATAMSAPPESLNLTPLVTSIQSAFKAVKGVAMSEAPEAGKAYESAFARSVENLPNVIVDALKGGGSVMKAAITSIGAGIGADLKEAIKAKLGGGLLGSLLGGLAGTGVTLLAGAVGNLFSGNDTKKGREAFAKSMGFSSLDSFYKELRTMGEEGQKLVHQGLNVIGKKDTAANEAWIRSVTELFQKQKDAAKDAADATEAAAAREVSAIDKAKAAVQAKIDAIQSEYDSLAQSIADEAPEEIMGVVEAATRAKMADLEKQKEILDQELKMAGEKVLDESQIVKDAMDKLFSKPLRVPVIYEGTMPARPGQTATYGGAMAEGGSGVVTRPTWFLAGAGPEAYNFTPLSKPAARGSSGVSIAINHPVVRQDSDITRLTDEIVRRIPSRLALAGL